MKMPSSILITTAALMVVTIWCAGFAKVFKVPSGELAAWAQAVGSVAAVVAAMLIANRQIRAQVEERRADRRELSIAINDAVNLALSSWSAVQDAIEQKNMANFIMAKQNLPIGHWSAFQSFGKLPVEKWPSTVLFVRMRHLEMAFDRFREAVENLKPHIHESDDIWTDAQTAEGALLLAEAEFRRTIAEIIDG